MQTISKRASLIFAIYNYEDIDKDIKKIENEENYNKDDVFKIPYQNLQKFKDKIEKLNKKAKKINCPEIVYKILGYKDDKDEDGKISRTYHVTLEGKAPKINGWEFIAALSHLPEGNVIRKVPGSSESEINAKFRTIGPLCEHCGQNRKRIDTFLLKSDDGKIKQVGRNCLRDFLGHQSPESIAGYAELLAQARESMGSEEGGSSANLLDMITYLTYVAATIREHGWVSAKKVKEMAEKGEIDLPQKTSHHATGYMFEKREKHQIKLSADDHSIAKEALEWVRNTLANKEELNDFEHNLVTACRGDAVHEQTKGIVASLIAVYRREKGLISERSQKAKNHEEAVKTSEFFGEVGKRGTFDLTLKSVKSFNTDYGASHLYSFVDKNGHHAIWFSSNWIREKDGKPLIEGKEYNITGSVKEHKTYNGLKQTVLTRCKIN